jgi:hypothetical protein
MLTLAKFLWVKMKLLTALAKKVSLRKLLMTLTIICWQMLNLIKWAECLSQSTKLLKLKREKSNKPREFRKTFSALLLQLKLSRLPRILNCLMNLRLRKSLRKNLKKNAQFVSQTIKLVRLKQLSKKEETQLSKKKSALSKKKKEKQQKRKERSSLLSSLTTWPVSLRSRQQSPKSKKNIMQRSRKQLLNARSASKSADSARRKERWRPREKLT